MSARRSKAQTDMSKLQIWIQAMQGQSRRHEVKRPGQEDANALNSAKLQSRHVAKQSQYRPSITACASSNLLVGVTTAPTLIGVVVGWVIAPVKSVLLPGRILKGSAATKQLVASINARLWEVCLAC